MPPLARLRLLLGLVLAGQGALVVTRILDHEAPLWLGFATLAAGCALLLYPLVSPAAKAPRDARADSSREGHPDAANAETADADAADAPDAPRAAVSPARARFVLALGLFALAGVLAYNALRGSTLAPPEIAILAYGAALVVASSRLDRWGRAVAYSFPLVLAPLSLYALNAALVAGVGGTPLALYIQHGLVVPMAATLGIVGIDVVMLGDTVRLATPRGALFLTVGVVCAGLYAGALFLGVFALFAWEQRTRGWRLVAYLALGLVGLHVANVLRLVLLALVGVRWGGDALQSFHQHAGWVLFLAWGVLFWWLVLRRFERPAHSRTTL